MRSGKEARSPRGLVTLVWALAGLVLALLLAWSWRHDSLGPLFAVAALAVTVIWAGRLDEDAALAALAPAHACLLGSWVMEMLAATRPADALLPGIGVPLIGLGAWRLFRRRAGPAAASPELIAHLGHELRTPLNALVGSAHLLEAGDLDRDRRRHVETLLSAGRSMTELLDSLLDLSTMNAGLELDVQHKPVAIAALVEEISGIWSASAEARGLSWQCGLDPRLPHRVRSDPVRIRQILSNLLDNAVRCTEQGGIRLDVSLRAGTSDRIAFEVADSGCGVAASEREAIFEPLRRGDRGGRLGLGLALSRALSEALGGELRMSSREGRGSEFTLLLPCVGVEAAREVAATSDAAAPGDADASALARFRHARVLVVEDHPAHRHILQTLLKLAGMSPTIVAGGAEALQALRTGPFDLVLMDLRMPAMDGAETARRIRQLDGDAAQVPVVLLTAGASPAEREQLLDSGIAAILPKPAEAGSLYRAMSSALEGDDRVPDAATG